MARVDFSNARIEFVTGSGEISGGNRTYTTPYGMPLGFYSDLFSDRTGTGATSIANVGRAITTNTSTKWVCNYSGTFTQSGSVIYLICAYTQGYGNWAVAKITNISYSVGDDFDFDIEITYSGE